MGTVATGAGQQMVLAERPSFSITAAIDPVTSFAHQQNGIPFIREVVVTNIGSTVVENSEVVVTFDPPFAEDKRIVIQRLSPGEEFKAATVDIRSSGSYLSAVTESTAGHLRICASADGTQLGQFIADIRLLPFDEWAGLSSLPELLSAFCQPNHPAVEQLLRSASDLLSAAGKQSSIEGYQSKQRNRVLEIISGIYASVANVGLTYANPPASFTQTGQRIRTADRILGTHLATCLDLCVLFASCFEQAGLHPVILLKKGHSFVGVWLDEDQFAAASSDDLQMVRKRVQGGELLVFESTLLTSRPPVPFDHALEHAKKFLTQDEEFEIAIDVYRARQERIFPLPTRTQTGHIATAEASPNSNPTGLTAITTISVPEDVAEPAIAAESASARLDRWKRKLLDLTLRNRLLNFRPSKSTVPVLCADAAKVEDALAAGEKLRFRSISSVINPSDPRNQEILQARYKTDALNGVLDEALAQKELYSELSEQELNTRLTEIYRSARSSFEEGGANTLFLAFGFLCWAETETSEKIYRAPLILVPVTLERKSVQQGFSLLIHDDEARINSSLLEMLRQDCELEIPNVDPLPTDDSGIHVDLVWKRFRRAVRDIPRWEVKEDVFLGLFSFAKYLMWKDLEDRTDDLKRSPIVEHLLDHPGVAFPDQGDFPDVRTLDDERHPEVTFAPLAADSSQMVAVYAAADGKSFVLDGPPGTGKSQTITNIISQCLATGKTVLFVSEKMAALEVVQRRLKQIGIDRFCLQLHSAKAKKADVIEHLGATWNLARQQASTEWKAEADRLQKFRSDLNLYVRELHRRYPNGLTPFKATATVVAGRNLPAVEFSWTGVNFHDSGILDGLRELARNLVVRSRQVEGAAGSVFRGIAATEWSPAWEKDFKTLAHALREAARSLEACSTAVAEILGVAVTGLSRTQIASLDLIATVLLESATVPATAAMLLSSGSFREQCNHAIEALDKRSTHWKASNGHYDESATSLDLRTIIAQVRRARQDWWPKSWFTLRSARKKLAAVTLSDRAATVVQLERDLIELIATADEENAIARYGTELAGKLGSIWKGKHTTVDELRRIVEWGVRFETALTSLSEAFGNEATQPRTTLERLFSTDWSSLCPQGRTSSKLNSFRRSFTDFFEAFKVFQSRIACDEEVVLGAPDCAFALEGIIDRVDRWLLQAASLRSWCNWCDVRHRAVSAGLMSIVALIEKDAALAGKLPDVFEYSYSKWWLSQVLDSVPVLCKFISEEHEAKIESFAEADRKFSELTRSYVSALLSSRVPQAHVEPGSGSELGLLAREMNKKSRHMPLRALIQKMPTVLSRLTPCLMMSPMSVAQYLDAGHPLFDVVVFDEASQIPVWDSIGAIARGKQLVVAGDPKQLPPTNFFGRATDDDETEGDEQQVEELESILDECNAIKLAPQHLEWHYRSRNESLITFSNRKYYENRLITFPSPATRDTAVTYHAINGVYDRSASRTNRSEANAVVEFVIAHLRNQNGRVKDGDWQTIGVVTFNSQQQTLIEDLLDAERQKYPELEPYFSKDAPEYVLVKNLENVQGDERDIMVFSTTYGADASGKRSMNFGPLNRDGGERRLNVAITRARVALHVFCSLGPEHIELSKTRKRGVIDLKHFLEYAQKGAKAMFAATDAPSEETESIFEEQVCEMLRGRGWTVHLQVGCSGYRIDLGIVDPRAPGRYLIGVECDGAMYHRAATARDRDRLRAMVLRGLGWRLHRIWSTDWWNNPEREIAKLDQLLNEIIAGKQDGCTLGVTVATISVTSAVAAAVEQPSTQYASLAVAHTQDGPAIPSTSIAAPDLPEYAVANVSSIPTGDSFYMPFTDDLIRAAIKSAIDLEGPVSAEVLVRRISSAAGFARSGARIRKRVVKLVPRAIARNSEGKMLFFWPEGTTPSSYTAFRVNPDGAEPLRAIDEISKEELANLLAYVVKQHAGVSEQQAIRDACRLLGYRRITESMSDRLAAILRKMTKEGRVKVVGESLVQAIASN